MLKNEGNGKLEDIFDRLEDVRGSKSIRWLCETLNALQ
jgi:hypothetical protein